MSTWTHVSGLIRINRQEKCKKIPDFGKIIDFYDEEWDETTLPMGSEGSLKYQVILEDSEKRKSESIAVNDIISVALFADLRDFEGEQLQELVSWVKSTFNKPKLPIGFHIRQGVVTIECEHGNHIMMKYHDGQWEIIE